MNIRALQKIRDQTILHQFDVEGLRQKTIGTYHGISASRVKVIVATQRKLRDGK